jgi:hypothetical protein
MMNKNKGKRNTKWLWYVTAYPKAVEVRPVYMMMGGRMLTVTDVGEVNIRRREAL